MLQYNGFILLRPLYQQLRVRNLLYIDILDMHEAKMSTFWTFCYNTMFQKSVWQGPYFLGEVSIDEKRGVIFHLWAIGPKKCNLTLAMSPLCHSSSPLPMYCITGNIRVQEIFANFANTARFAKFSCTRILFGKVLYIVTKFQIASYYTFRDKN